MSKLVEGAINLVGKTEVGKEFNKTLDTFKSIIPFSKEAKDAKTATIDEVKQNYISIAKSLGKGGEDDVKVIEDFFGDGGFFSGGKTEDFVALNTELKHLANTKGGNATVFDAVVKIGSVEFVGGGIAAAAVNAIDSVKKIAQKANLTYDEKDLGKINEDLTKLRSEVDNPNNVVSEGQDPEKENNVINNSLEGWDGSVEGLRGKIVLPLKGDDVYLTSGHGHFGDDRGTHEHNGIDLGAESDEVIAPYTMEIIKIAYQANGTGESVRGVIHPKTDPEVLFKVFHLRERPDLQIGQIIQQGETFATEGSTGRSSGEHLHFELWIDGVAQDPLKAFDPNSIKYKQDGKLLSFSKSKYADQYSQVA